MTWLHQLSMKLLRYLGVGPARKEKSTLHFLSLPPKHIFSNKSRPLHMTRTLLRGSAGVPYPTTRPRSSENCGENNRNTSIRKPSTE